jgi:hypothetical protein
MLLGAYVFSNQLVGGAVGNETPGRRCDCIYRLCSWSATPGNVAMTVWRFFDEIMSYEQVTIF